MPKTPEQTLGAIGKYPLTLFRRVKDDPEIHRAVDSALDAIEQGGLSWARLNQVLHLCSEAGTSEGFYRYYFLSVPSRHPYPVERVFPSDTFKLATGLSEITSLEQFRWGIRRFQHDAMLFWGNFRQAYRDLRQKSFEHIEALFGRMAIDTPHLLRRGRVTDPSDIRRDDRYLISEIACKTLDKKDAIVECEHVRLALNAFRELNAQGLAVTPEILRTRTEAMAKNSKQSDLFELMFEDPRDPVATEEEVVALYTGQHRAFQQAREAALSNTRIYLSICNDLDVYVATSMRTRDDFREMAKASEIIFRSERLAKFNLRYFDPTLSAAKYHEDKGIIECLMVKTAKALLYFAQHKESLGKISEYAMAASLGKPVIILCPEDERGTEIFQFYRDRHPLLRLIEFKTGIVNGAIVTNKISDVPILIERILTNQMEYDLELKPNTEGYYLLKERMTQSTVRVITDDRLLTETFWNYYHNIQ